MTTLTTSQIDRACGAVLASAAGDALGAPYEFDRVRPGPEGPQMLGGGIGGFAPGEWTDDTSMAWAILDVAATGADLRTEDALTQIALRFREWYDDGPADVGIQTSQVLGRAGQSPTGASMAAAARELHERTGRTAGNGSLMRTGPVALAHLDDEAACAEAARAVSALTHVDQRAQEACVLWSLAIRHAILTGSCDVRVGLAHVDADYWTARIDEAEAASDDRVPGAQFNPNGWVVPALQAAWAAIDHWRDAGRDQLELALTSAIEIGHDTDTVAAIAGALLGATWGASAVPGRWRRILHGYPRLTGEQLVHLAHLAATRGPTPHGWPTIDRIDYSAYGSRAILVQHPHDPGVWLGNVLALDELPDEITAVVSLCLVGNEQVPPGREHVVYRLIDRAGGEDNRNLDYVLGDIALTITGLRAEGHQVFVHCVAAESRTPTAGIAYSMLLGISYDDALRDVCGVLPRANPNRAFREALGRTNGQRR